VVLFLHKKTLLGQLINYSIPCVVAFLPCKRSCIVVESTIVVKDINEIEFVFCAQRKIIRIMGRLSASVSL